MKAYVRALILFVFEGNFQMQAPRGLYSEGLIIGAFLHFEFLGVGGGSLYMEGHILES